MTDEPAVGQVWRGRNHGSLLKVAAVEDQDLFAFVMYAGNPYWLHTVGTVRRFPRNGWDTLMDYAPEWNEPQRSGDRREVT